MINVMTKAAQKPLMKLHEATPGTGTDTSTCRTVRYPVRVPYSVRVPYLVTMDGGEFELLDFFSGVRSRRWEARIIEDRS